MEKDELVEGSRSAVIALGKKWVSEAGVSRWLDEPAQVEANLGSAGGSVAQMHSDR